MCHVPTLLVCINVLHRVDKKALCTRACVLWLVPCCFLFFFLYTGDEILASAPERRWALRTSSQKTKTYQLSAGLGGRAESAGLSSTSHPPALSQRTPCTRALCARSHKTQYPLDTKCLCTRACVLWLVPCCFLFFFLHTGDEILASAPERRWAPRTSPQHPGARLDSKQGQGSSQQLQLFTRTSYRANGEVGHDELTTSQRRIKSCRLRRQQRGPRVSKPGPAPPLTGRRTPRQPGGTPILLPSFVHGLAPADSPPAHRPSGAAGLPAPLTPHIHNFRTNFIPDQRGGRARRAHDVSTPDQVVPPPTAATRAPRLHARLLQELIHDMMRVLPFTPL